MAIIATTLKAHELKNGKKTFSSDKFILNECLFLKVGMGACGWEHEDNYFLVA